MNNQYEQLKNQVETVLLTLDGEAPTVEEFSAVCKNLLDQYHQLQVAFESLQLKNSALHGENKNLQEVVNQLSTQTIDRVLSPKVETSANETAEVDTAIEKYLSETAEDED